MKKQVSHSIPVELVKRNALGVVAGVHPTLDSCSVLVLWMQFEVQATEVHAGVLANNIVLGVLGATLLLECVVSDDL